MTYLGWTTDGKTCVNDNTQAGDTASQFEVLSRTDASFFQLNMSGSQLKNHGKVDYKDEKLNVIDYLIRYEDLQRAYIKNGNVNYVAAKYHWKVDGKKEGRNPGVFVGCAGIQGIPELQRKHVFDPCFYLAKYADLKNAFGNDYKKALNHWGTIGFKEGRQSAVNFSIRAYVNRYSDLKLAFTHNGKVDYSQALNHWYTHGEKEGRNPRP